MVFFKNPPGVTQVTNNLSPLNICEDSIPVYVNKTAHFQRSLPVFHTSFTRKPNRKKNLERSQKFVSVFSIIKKLCTPLPRGSSLCEGMGEGCCTQPYPCICKEAVSGFEPMTNKSPRHNFTAAPGLDYKGTKQSKRFGSTKMRDSL
ncbi:hypothetical protein HKD37_07G018046 [Glycine soja]